MAGRNPQDAYQRFINPLQEVVLCISPRKFSLMPRPSGFTEGTIYRAFLGGDTPVPLTMDDGRAPITVTLMQEFRIIKTEKDDDRGPFKTKTVRYFYSITDAASDKELIAYQWTPETRDPAQKTFPHLHLGQQFTGNHDLFPDSNFHKMHIPTGRISVEAFVRLVIDEFGVKPQKLSWERILRRHEDAFVKWRTRS